MRLRAAPSWFPKNPGERVLSMIRAPVELTAVGFLFPLAVEEGVWFPEIYWATLYCTLCLGGRALSFGASITFVTTSCGRYYIYIVPLGPFHRCVSTWSWV